MIDIAAIWTAVIDDPHNRLTVKAEELWVRPALIEMTRATYGDRLSVGIQFPTTEEPISSGFTVLRLRASLITVVPKSTGSIIDRLPSKEPIADLTALNTNTSFIQTL